jgi:hypothetical protein
MCAWFGGETAWKVAICVTSRRWGNDIEIDFKEQIWAKL